MTNPTNTPPGICVPVRDHDQLYQWVSRNGHMEARIFNESAEEVLFFFRRVGATSRGVAKAMNKDGFRQAYRLRPMA